MTAQAISLCEVLYGRERRLRDSCRRPFCHLALHLPNLLITKIFIFFLHILIKAYIAVYLQNHSTHPCKKDLLSPCASSSTSPHLQDILLPHPYHPIIYYITLFLQNHPSHPYKKICHLVSLPGGGHPFWKIFLVDLGDPPLFRKKSAK